MPEFFFPLIIFGFLVFHVFFGSERIRKLKNNLQAETEQEIIKKYFNVSGLCITGCFYTTFCRAFFPGVYRYLFPINALHLNFLNCAGMLVIKISFVCMIV